MPPSVFSDVCEVYGKECDAFFECAARLQVEHAFKAEKVAFRERKRMEARNCSEKLHGTQRIPLQDEM